MLFLRLSLMIFNKNIFNILQILIYYYQLKLDVDYKHRRVILLIKFINYFNINNQKIILLFDVSNIKFSEIKIYQTIEVIRVISFDEMT